MGKDSFFLKVAALVHISCRRVTRLEYIVLSMVTCKFSEPELRQFCLLTDDFSLKILFFWLIFSLLSETKSHPFAMRFQFLEKSGFINLPNGVCEKKCVKCLISSKGTVLVLTNVKAHFEPQWDYFSANALDEHVRESVCPITNWVWWTRCINLSTKRSEGVVNYCYYIVNRWRWRLQNFKHIKICLKQLMFLYRNLLTINLSIRVQHWNL